MGRPPCCDKVGIKKGPWTPEEDIILVSYIQQHGPGNWRSVPTNTGLLRCSKSCRLRWTNYLRPGIKRGNFTPHEEGMIIHLQALLGNKWAAIASYLPQRTDNDIKNYWNTHLKKKIQKFQTALDPQVAAESTTCQHGSKSNGDKKSLDIIHHSSAFRLNQTSAYASSTENISRLLQGWMRSSPKGSAQRMAQQAQNQSNSLINNSINNEVGTTFVQCYQPKAEEESCDIISHEEIESLLSFENLSSVGLEKSSSDSTLNGSQSTTTDDKLHILTERKQRLENQPPLSFIEKWLLDETGGHVDEIMGLSPIF